MDMTPARPTWKKRFEIGLIDEAGTLEEVVDKADLVIVAVPVHTVSEMLPSILDRLNNQVVMDVSSTKENIINSVKDHPKRGRFVATHPMWGTEYSGPAAAIAGAFSGKVAVISGKADSDADAVELVEEVYRQLGMHILYMDAGSHDLHAAYVSHISHITSFALANTVWKKKGKRMPFSQWPALVLKVLFGWPKATPKCGCRYSCRTGKIYWMC